jgi:hypothetical protein
MAPGDVEAGDRVAERTLGARHCLQVREDGYCFACGSENPIGLALDEAMAKSLYLQDIEALTCEITVRLCRAVTVGEALKLTACLVRERRRLLELQAEAVSQDGKTVATAQAKFLRVGSCEINA